MRKDGRIELRLSNEQKAVVEAAAEYQGFKSVSEYIRSHLPTTMAEVRPPSFSPAKAHVQPIPKP